ncbi:hypothetical protein HWV62_2454 [Athelia sp. TMB]|nr:hypothetical protein HWV62_2454 [Athelia sp. TMB]
MASSSTKKRKHALVEATDSVAFALSGQPESQIGPVLVCYPAIQPSKTIPFDCYSRKKAKNDDHDDHDFSTRPTFVAAESHAIEFFSSDESQRAAAGCRYLVGVHNKRTGITTLRAAPLHLLAHRVKALKSLKPMPVTAQQRIAARAALGETFGTKKAKANIRAQERNKVDVSAMEGVASHLQDRIDQSTTALPTQEEAKEAADSSRLIPPYNLDAQIPGDVYRLHDIIPEAEWKALSITALTTAESSKDRVALLPYSRSSWINQHLSILFAAGVLNKKVVKILMYVSVLMAFRKAAYKEVTRSTIEEKLPGVPGIIVDGLLSRFTESSRGSASSQVTGNTQTLILTHMFALCLRVDDFATDSTLLATDLSMPVAKINTLFKSLGCTISKLTQRDLAVLGLPDTAGETKRAVLKCPVQFPKSRVKRSTR